MQERKRELAAAAFERSADAARSIRTQDIRLLMDL